MVVIRNISPQWFKDHGFRTKTDGMKFLEQNKIAGYMYSDLDQISARIRSIQNK